jgi:hypothetical protein
VVCNEVIEDKRTNNKTLVGLFNQIAVNTLPSVHPRMFVLVSLTDLSGKAAVTIRISSPHKKVAEFPGELQTEDPRAVADIVLELRGLPMEEAGPYRIDVLVNEVSIADRYFQVVLQPATGEPPRNPAGPGAAS